MLPTGHEVLFKGIDSKECWSAKSLQKQKRRLEKSVDNPNTQTLSLVDLKIS